MATLITSSPHVALFPCAGMDHLLPFLRLAAMLASRSCTVTVITAHPTVSTAESDHLSTFFANHPHIRRLPFQLLPYKKSKFTNDDPFFIHVETIANSLHLLYPLILSLSPSLSAIFADFPVTNTITNLASDLSIPTYTVITTSATFFSVTSHLPQLARNKNHIEVPGLGPTPVSNIPPPLLNPNHFFTANICSNVSSLNKVKGILINTFNSFESEAIEALTSNEITSDHPAPILPIGPLESFDIEKTHNLPWLDEQAPESVVFISFGSRTTLTKDQITELATGIENSGCKFLWVLKTSKVDKDDKDEIEDVLGESFIERTKKQGVVVKGWVNQEQILAHPAIGGFVSHCGWNSVIEAARLGVPILGWPQHGDQKVNAEVVEKAGLGVWVRGWGWGGERMVGENEIAEKIRDVMVNKGLRGRAKEVKEKAIQAKEINGSSEAMLRGLIHSLKSKEGI